MLREQLQGALYRNERFTPTTQLLFTIDEDLEALDSIYECGLTQERISNDVLSLGKIQLDMMQMFDVDKSIRREAQKIVSVFQNEARMKRIALSLKVSPAFDQLGIHSIKTDHMRLGQVMTNLLTNAIRFTGNSPVRCIELKLDVGLEAPVTNCQKPPANERPVGSGPIAEDTTVYLFVSVSDTGPGLTPDELGMLFQRFSQASPKTHTVYGGSGLGLFVCRKLAELMGGRIEVTSEPNQGCQFSFFVTAKAGAGTPSGSNSVCVSPVLGATALLKTLPENGVPLPFDPDGPVSTRAENYKPRILVVEDNLINRKVLIRQLTHVGLEVDWAQDGQEALEKIKRVMSPRSREGQAHALQLQARSDVPVDSIASRMASASSTPLPPAEGPASALLFAANQAQEAPPHEADKPYDVVLMDLEMPVMDGYTATQRVRREENAGKLESSPIIIALTGNARQAQIEETMADFDDVVIKPYRLDDLLRKMEAMIRKRRDGGERRPPLTRPRTTG